MSRGKSSVKHRTGATELTVQIDNPGKFTVQIDNPGKFKIQTDNAGRLLSGGELREQLQLFSNPVLVYTTKQGKFFNVFAPSLSQLNPEPSPSQGLHLPPHLG